MEDLRILEFISLCCGYDSNLCEGLGRGDGSGAGTGLSSGFGRGSGAGIGCGYADGSGAGIGYNYDGAYGSGEGYISNKSLIIMSGKKVYIVDDIATTISHVHGNIAKGTIINNDLTETPCYIVKEGGCFAHGKTLAEANTALQDKLFEEMPTDERIAAFWKCHKKGVKYPTKDFFEWHHKLTGSCLMGRQQFAKDHGIDLEGEMTVEEFITLTENSFGGDIIRQLEED